MLVGPAQLVSAAVSAVGVCGLAGRAAALGDRAADLGLGDRVVDLGLGDRVAGSGTRGPGGGTWDSGTGRIWDSGTGTWTWEPGGVTGPGARGGLRG